MNNLNFLEVVGIATIAAGSAYVFYKIGYMKGTKEARIETTYRNSDNANTDQRQS